MIATKMAKLFYQVKEENFSAKISNWEHSRYCGKNQTILFSMLPSQHRYRKFDLFYLLDIFGSALQWCFPVIEFSLLWVYIKLCWINATDMALPNKNLYLTYTNNFLPKPLRSASWYSALLWRRKAVSPGLILKAKFVTRNGKISPLW